MAAGNQGERDRSGEASLASPREASAPLAGLQDLLDALYAASEASQFGISRGHFTDILTEVVRQYDTIHEGSSDVRELLSSLKIAELVLARACAAGNERAWEKLLNTYREQLYEMGCVIAKDDVLGKELADSLYADLYGISARGEQCPSKLNYYNGLGSLAGWMRTVMVQNFIDRCRRERRLATLDEEDKEDRPHLPELIEQAVELPTLPDPRISEVVDSALAAMDPEDRFILASYYLDHLNLSDLSTILDVHQSNVSRRLEKITSKLRKAVRVGLLRRGMKPAEVDEALRSDVRDLDLDVGRRLKENTQKPEAGSFFRQRAISKQSNRS